MLANDLEKSKNKTKQNTHSVCRSLRSYILLKGVKNLEPHPGHLFKLKSAECALDFFNGPVGEAVFFGHRAPIQHLYNMGGEIIRATPLFWTKLFFFWRW